MERTLILIKPDGVQRGLIGQILSRFEDKGLAIAGMKLMHMSEDLAKKHYEPHQDRPFFAPLVQFMTSSPIVALTLEGVNAISICRKLVGATFGPDAEPGTIRGDYGMSRSFNLIHASDSLPSAAREIQLFFEPNELLDIHRAIQPWIYDTEDLALAETLT
ncbi:MAG: nucleoside-diphosphate kinase [Planctomycetota bacterium]|jgi:nucleoside-diphosphate kinase|nr:nucleoside-diphosphate kinase [Planctomycetota bacterium]